MIAGAVESTACSMAWLPDLSLQKMCLVQWVEDESLSISFDIGHIRNASIDELPTVSNAIVMHPSTPSQPAFVGTIHSEPCHSVHTSTAWCLPPGPLWFSLHPFTILFRLFGSD